MTVDRHPITPPPDLVQEWIDEPQYMTEDQLGKRMNLISMNEVRFREIIDKVSQYGADMELDACVEWLGDAPVVYNNNDDLHPGLYLRDDRRPKPPSLREQALEALEHILHNSSTELGAETIRRALEALPQ